MKDANPIRGLRGSRIVAGMICLLAWLASVPAVLAGTAADGGEVAYSISVRDPAGQAVEVEASFPVEAASTVLYMPVWTPGYYVREDHKAKVSSIRARDEHGRERAVTSQPGNRWLADTAGAQRLRVHYTLQADGRSVSLNELTPGYVVLNGPATYISSKGSEALPHTVSLHLPQGWRIATGLRADAARPGRYLADDQDELLDSPIMAGELDFLHFEAGATPHVVAYNRGVVELDGERLVADLQAMVAVTRSFWREQPWRGYVFMLAFREAGGGLEHRHSTFVNVDPRRFATPQGYPALLNLLAHEYQHAFNVKRLRPVELGPFDYEQAPVLSTLWIPEGLTSYYSNLMLVRSGRIDAEGYLRLLSRQVTALQASPGRLKQSLEQSSREVWSNSLSGVAASDETVSYYTKGEVAGFLLDARIRRLSGGLRSLDDAMRLAYGRYSGETGFTAAQFAEVVAEVAGQPLDDWFATVIAAPGEVDYADALDWFGLSLQQAGADGKAGWTLAPAADAGPVRRARLQAWLSAE